MLEKKLNIIKKMDNTMLLEYFSKYSKQDLLTMDFEDQKIYMMIHDEILNRMSNK